MPTGVNVPITFQIYKGGQLVRTETLTQDIIKVGKLSSSHLRIDDESVSRMHAVIEIASASEIYIIDLGSTKGTIVNGQKVNKCRIQSGDEIVLGDTKLLVSIGAAVAAESAPAPQPSAAPPQARSTVMGMRAITPAPGSIAATPPPAAVPPPVAAPVPPPVAAAVPPPMAAAIPPPMGAIPPPTGAIPPPTGARMPAAAMPVAAPQPAYQLPPGFAEAVEVNDGTKAIEVVSMFEDAIVDTRHFTNPASGEVSGATKGLIFGGIGTLVAALALFIVAWFQVDGLQKRREVWEHKHPGANMAEFCNNSENASKDSDPPYAMVCPRREGPLMDIVFAMLLVSAVTMLIIGLIRRFNERKPRHFMIGPGEGALVNVPAERVPSPLFPLVHSTGTSYELCFTQHMEGDVTLEGQQVPLRDLISRGRAHQSHDVPGAHSFTIPDGARAKIDIGQSTFLVNSVPRPRTYPVPLDIDWGAQAYTGGAFLVCSLFLALIFSIPPDPKSLSLDAFMNDQRFAKFLIKPPEEKEEQIPEWLKKKGPDEAGGKGKRHKGEEGKMGKKTSKNKTGLYALKGPKDNPDPHLAKMLAEEQAKNAGVLGILKREEGSHLASIFGRDSALGNDAENVLGGLVGTQIGEAYGVGGLGLVGTGRGGGGTGEGTIGLGNLGTIGKGGGGGSGSGYGRGAGGLGGRRAHAPDVVPGTAQVRGSLDKEIIRRIIRRHINEVKFCYEKELAKKPDLYGRVIVQFTIAGSGQVVASVVQQSTMNNGQVDQCIAGAVRRWEFPKPQGGGIVIVSYPFVLKAAGGEGE